MTKVVHSPDERLAYDSLIPSLPRWPDHSSWKDWRLFGRRNGKTGREDYLLCSFTSTEVYVYKHPLASKTDEGLSGSRKDADFSN